MKWEKQYHRTIKRFAIFPVCIDDEYRWLEMVYIEQKLCRGFWHDWWEDKSFVSKSEYLQYKQEKK